MKQNIPFFKYTCYGNNFVVVDETRTSLLTEREKSSFAYQATNVHYGVGSDNFLVIQPFASKTLKGINDVRRYWRDLPDSTAADFIFRMFEPDGAEAFSCANGLMSLANHLNRQYGIKSAQIVTEVPTSTPRVVSIGTHANDRTSWANMGHPRRMPLEMAGQSVRVPCSETIDSVRDLEISFRKYDLQPFSQEQSLRISGYLVFTGEPHLVVFTEEGFSLRELSKLVFISSHRNAPKAEKAEKRVAFGSWLVHHIGTHLNTKYQHLFPAGINVNFAQVVKNEDVLEYRCFERGINRETLACGTGALAVAFVGHSLDLLKRKQVMAWPHRCRWHEPQAQMKVKQNKDGWLLHGSPVMLCEGTFMLQKTLNIVRCTADYRSRLTAQSAQVAEPSAYHAPLHNH